VKTGIFKEPINAPIFLGKEDVVDDKVVDRKYHGGIDKACYIYSADCYPFWKEKYPEVSMNFGTFGENITIEGLDEKKHQNWCNLSNWNSQSTSSTTKTTLF
jgi:MOSC domain-containing protein YiiM